MPDDGITIDLIPNFEELESELDNKSFNKEVDISGDGTGGAGGGAQGQGGMLSGLFGIEAGSDIATGGGKGSGLMGGMGGGGMMAMLGKMAALVGVGMIIAKAVSGLPQIQAIMDMINTAIQLTLMPFVNMLFTFLKPILIDLIKLMPKWLAFWQNPVQNLMALATFIGDKVGEFFMRLPGMLVNAIMGLPEKVISGDVNVKEVIKRGIIGYGGNLEPLLGSDLPLMALLSNFVGGLTGQKEENFEQTLNVTGLSSEATVNKIQEEKRTNPMGE